MFVRDRRQNVSCSSNNRYVSQLQTKFGSLLPNWLVAILWFLQLHLACCVCVATSGHVPCFRVMAVAHLFLPVGWNGQHSVGRQTLLQVWNIVVGNTCWNWVVARLTWTGFTDGLSGHSTACKRIRDSSYSKLRSPIPCYCPPTFPDGLP